MSFGIVRAQLNHLFELGLRLGILSREAQLNSQAVVRLPIGGSKPDRCASDLVLEPTQVVDGDGLDDILVVNKADRAGADEAVHDFTRKVKPMDLALMVLQLGGGVRSTIPSLVTHASLFSKAVLALLLVMSVYSWATIWNRMRLYAAVARQDD